MSQSRIKLSVIIPVYNGEETIERAIRSAASMEDVEVVVAENGSDDDTTKVVEELQKELKNVVLIHSSKGVSAARNAALKIAQGEWVAFADADDYIEETGLFRMMNDAIQGSADLCLYGHCAGQEVRSVTDSEQLFEKEDVLKARVMMLENPTRYMQVWAKLFKNSIIKENNITFNENLRFSEDSEFTLRYSRFCSSIKISPEITYHYSVDASSVMRTFDGKKCFEYANAMRQTLKVVEGENEQIMEAFDKYVLMHMNIAMVREVYAKANPSSGSEKNAAMKKLAAEDIFAGAIKRTKASKCLSARMLPVLFFKMKLPCLSAAIYKIRAQQNFKREG